MEQCDSLIQDALDSLAANVGEVRELVQPGVFQCVLNVLCILSFIFSAWAMLKVALLEDNIKWQRKIKKFIEQCENHKKKKKKKNIPSDINERIKNTLQTFVGDISKIHFRKKKYLNKKIQMLNGSSCDKVQLLDNIIIEFNQLILQ